MSGQFAVEELSLPAVRCRACLLARLQLFQVHLRNKAAKTRSKLAFVKKRMSPKHGDDEAARMFKLSSTLLNTLVHMQDEGKVRLTVNDAAEGEALDITKQGNADHYTTGAVRDRKRLSYDVRIRAITHIFWLIAVQDDRQATAIDYDQYCTIFARITKVGWFLGRVVRPSVGWMGEWVIGCTNSTNAADRNTTH